MSVINHIGAKQLGALAAILAILLSDDLGEEEVNNLGNFITGIGCILLIIAAQKEFLSEQQEKKTTKSEAVTINQLKERIEKLEARF